MPVSDQSDASFHPALRWAAKVVSVLLHPLFIPVYLSWFLIYVYQNFPAFGPREKVLLLIRFFVMYTVFPLVTILLAKGLGFVQSIYLRTQKDRIVPYVACGLYYFWMWYVLRNQPEIPKEPVMLSLAIFIAASFGLVLNSSIKVSMHGLAAGVAVVFILLLAFRSYMSLGPYIAVILLLAGMVCTARLVNSDHRPVEVYLGVALGALSQLIAYWV